LDRLVEPGAPVLRVGLTGGIGSGKSSVAGRLAEHGAVVVDADLLARRAVEPGTPGLAEVVIAFGPGVLTSTGELNRAVLGQLVFDDKTARARLEAIVHPRVRALAAQIERAAPTDAVVVHDIPLLVETRQSDDFDLVVVVDSPPEVQLERLTAGRGMDVHQAQARIAAQASRQDRLAAADVVISNAGSLADLRSTVDALWVRLADLARGHSGPSPGSG
jgi:dephospho-CoA kinase